MRTTYTGFYPTKEAAEEDLPRMKDILKNSSFGANRVWLDKIMRNNDHGYTVWFSY